MVKLYQSIQWVNCLYVPRNRDTERWKCGNLLPSKLIWELNIFSSSEESWIISKFLNLNWPLAWFGNYFNAVANNQFGPAGKTSRELTCNIICKTHVNTRHFWCYAYNKLHNPTTTVVAASVICAHRKLKKLWKTN